MTSRPAPSSRVHPVRRLLSNWRADPQVGGHVAAWRDLPARPAQLRPLPESLHPALQDALRNQGISYLYAHQDDAWSLAYAGHNVALVTGTASGKTLAYNLPVLNSLLQDPEARALYLFPTKALAQDQWSGLQALAGSIHDEDAPVTSAVYDGDTPAGRRPTIRARSRVVISNPDMLHTGILPHHTVWADFFRSLRYVVIDEMHVYRGVFGSHVANVLRRLKRVANFYGSFPQFFLTSATIANPGELAERLIEAEVALVDNDGSARGPKSFLIYNPPVIDPDLGLRRSALQEGVRLAEDLLTYGVQTIIFGRSRRSVELLLTYLRSRPAVVAQAAQAVQRDPERWSSQAEEAIRGYRSGYLPQTRRAIEQGLRQGDVRAVVATTALELGIDIGGMGATLMVGYPGSVSGVWQQAGRAGRGSDPSMAVLVATADPLDQFLAAHPDYFFERPPEQALINPDNLLILLDHLRCAAFEVPFRTGEGFGRVPPEQVQEFLAVLAAQGVLHHSGPKYFWMADEYPAQAVSLRSASATQVVLQLAQPPEVETQPVTIGIVDTASALWLVHPQAVYLHEGQSYVVESLDLENSLAQLQRVDTDYYTEPRSETEVSLVEQQLVEPACGGEKAYGELNVTRTIVGYRKVRWYTHENLGLGELELPPTQLLTTGYWLSLSDNTVDTLRQRGLWTNDPNDYGPTWRVQRDLARARDGYRCQVCGTPENGRTHDVHHKVPFRTFRRPDGSFDLAQAHQLNNLATLCPACHRRVETAVRVRSGLAGLGFVMGHLAPFFLMCDWNDLGVHTDPQSALANGAPTVVVYDQVPAGIGLSRRLFDLHAELMQRAHELVSACPCNDGCPSCVGPGGENGLGGKAETLALLEALSATDRLDDRKPSHF